MKKVLGVFALFLIVLYIFSFVSPVLAESGSEDNSGSGEDSEDNSGSGEDSEDNSGSGEDSEDNSGSGEDSEDNSGRSRDSSNSEDSKDGIVREEERVEERTEERKRYYDSEGNLVEVRVRNEITKDSENRLEERISFVDENGNIIEIRNKVEKGEGQEEYERKLYVNGIEVKSKLVIKENFEEGSTKIKATLSNGNSQEVKIMPDRASEIALEVLRAKGIELELKEVGNESGEKELVYSGKFREERRFLGLIKISGIVETLIDPETGEIKEVNRPWWSFLTFEDNSNSEEVICTEELFVCDDGTTVSRNSNNNCEFDLCPIVGQVVSNIGV